MRRRLSQRYAHASHAAGSRGQAARCGHGTCFVLAVVLVDMEEPADPSCRVGRTLRDKWRLDALIDVGGMAAVYAATHRNGMRGAVKILHGHRSNDAEVVERFRREGRIANHVGHPNAVRVLDDDVDDDGSVFLVMELLEGSTLWERAVARGGRLPAREVLRAADQILDVLAAAHELSVLHRDIKPENVFVRADGTIKVLDFGIARSLEGADDDRTRTIDGMPMGSPAFMSPEQARGRWDLVGPQSDLWSVGATMFTLLSGRDVHTEETVPELLAATFTKPAPSLGAVMPECDPRIVAIVDRALQIPVAARWQDARSMQAAVRAAAREIDVPPHVTVVVPSARAARPRRVRPVAVACAAALAATLAVAAVASVPRAEEAPPTPIATLELGESTAAPRSAPAAPGSLPPPATLVEPASPPAIARPAAPVVAPVLRARRRPSIYDRRW